MQDKPKKFVFNVFVENTEDGAYIAHCLETGLVATSADINELPFKMAKMLYRQISFAIENNNEADIFHAAPPDVWKRFFEFRGAPPEHLEKNIQAGGVGFILGQNTYAATAQAH